MVIYINTYILRLPQKYSYLVLLWYLLILHVATQLCEPPQLIEANTTDKIHSYPLHFLPIRFQGNLEYAHAYNKLTSVG